MNTTTLWNSLFNLNLPPLVATPTLALWPHSDGSATIIGGLDLTYDLLTNEITGGTATSITHTQALTNVVLHEYLSFSVPAIDIVALVRETDALVDDLATNLSSLVGLSISDVSGSSTQLLYQLGDGSQFIASGTDLNQFGNAVDDFGTVTSFMHLAADGITVLGQGTPGDYNFASLMGARNGDSLFSALLAVREGGATTATAAIYQPEPMLELDITGGDQTINVAGLDPYVISYGLHNDSIAADLVAGQVSRNGAMDTITGTPEYTIVGSSFDDTFVAAADGSKMSGNDGNDKFISGSAADVIMGGNGADTVCYINSNEGVNVSLLTEQSLGGDAADDVFSSIESLHGSQHNDILTGTATNNALRGDAGNDILRPYQGADFIDGGDGIDILDYTYTAVGLDINLSANTVLRMDGHMGEGGYSQNVHNIEFVRSSFGNDFLRANIETDTTLYGYEGDDIIIGFNGKDRLIGGKGDDRMSGGNNDDLLYGQEGADMFFATNTMGQDRVMDWEDGVDVINMGSVSGVSSFDDLIIQQGPNGGTIRWAANADGGGENHGFILNSQLASVIDEGDFVF